MASEARAFTVDSLEVAFRSNGSLTTVVRDVAFGASAGRITGIAGESGSGKTTAALSSIGYVAPGAERLSGSIRLDGRPLEGLTRRELRSMWAHQVSYVAQDAASALNPARKIGGQLIEVARHSLDLGRAEARERVLELLEAVALPNPPLVLGKYPHQFSGGELQRIAIALSLVCEPELLVLDEPTTGLDVTTQAEVTEMLGRLVKERGIAALYISHDLPLLQAISDELVIFYAGEVVEAGPTMEVTRAPRHPYTRALLDSVLSTSDAFRPALMGGRAPESVVSGRCAFTPRCRWAQPACAEQHPELRAEDDGRLVRCLRAAEIAPLGSTRNRNEGEDGARPADSPLLEARELTCVYGKGARRTVAADAVSFSLAPRRVTALVGESGSGKTTIGRMLAGIIRPESGELLWCGKAMPHKLARRTPEQRREIQFVFQHAEAALNPRHTVATLVERALVKLRPDVVGRAALREATLAALAEVKLGSTFAQRYPRELSGGQKQRVAIARALVARPALMICDEILSGQDVSVQAAILELLRDTSVAHEMATLLITHDLGVVRSLADETIVLEEGRIVEHGPTAALFAHPQHPYTRKLLAAARANEVPATRDAGRARPSVQEWFANDDELICGV